MLTMQALKMSYFSGNKNFRYFSKFATEKKARIGVLSAEEWSKIFLLSCGVVVKAISES